MITIKKFIKQLDEGKITDFQQCIAELPNEYIIELIKRGLEIDEIVKRGDPELIINIIRYGHGQEYYPYWKHNSDSRVRKALVSQEYALDEFINDKNCDIRIAVVDKDHKYAIQIINKTKKNGTLSEISSTVNQIHQLNCSKPIWQAQMVKDMDMDVMASHRGY